MFVGIVWPTLFRFFLFFIINVKIPFLSRLIFMKWIMVFISLLIIMIIECACCHLYCLCFYALPSIKNTVIYFCYASSGLSFLGSIYIFVLQNLCPKYRIFMVFISFYPVFHWNIYGYSISSVFMVLHRFIY